MSNESARDRAIEQFKKQYQKGHGSFIDALGYATLQGFKAGFDAGYADASPKPQDAILFCPKCKEQHIDKAEPDKCESCGHPESEHFGHNGDDYNDVGCYACGGITQNGCHYFTAWLNPPHKKHRCHGCNHVWKPLLILTNGVAELEEPND